MLSAQHIKLHKDLIIEKKKQFMHVKVDLNKNYQKKYDEQIKNHLFNTILFKKKYLKKHLLSRCKQQSHSEN